MFYRQRQCAFTFLLLVPLSQALWADSTSAQPSPTETMLEQNHTPTVNHKLSGALIHRLKMEPGPAKAWIFFTDKGITSPTQYRTAIKNLAATYNRRAIQRRMLRGRAARGGGLFDQRDLPVKSTYIEAITANGARLHVTSRWLNAVSVYATRRQAEQIAALPFVDHLEAVGRSRRIKPVDVEDKPFSTSGQRGRLDYGRSNNQLQQINLLALHDDGFTGAGVVVGILDTGFERSHEAFNHIFYPVTVVAEYDFVDNDGNTQAETGDPYSQHEHGTKILGCIGSYKPGDLVGGAYSASFILCKTEDTTAEYPAEEDNFVAGLEFIEMNGGDMSTSSLGYIDWYTQADLDGQTAVTTIAVNISTSLGVHHCNAAGNDYHDSNPSTSSLIAPSDAFQSITCGAVYSDGEIAYFSSDGPSADGRVKPEVLARGISTYTVDPHSATSYTTANGTSLSTPLVACAVACLIEAKPQWSVDQMRSALFETADYYVANGTYDPLYVRGYGVIDALAAKNAGSILADLNCDGSVDSLDIDPFVLALSSTPPSHAEYYAEYPNCDHLLADCNSDGTLDSLDIDPFVTLLNQ